MGDIGDINVIGRLDIKGRDIIRRVYSTDGVAPTLDTCGGGMREVKILDLSRYRVRKLTPTEYGRLQAFPMENWEQVVSDSQAYKQFGNAVTVSVVTAIANNLRAVLEQSEETTTPEEKNLPCAPYEAMGTVQSNPLEQYTVEELLTELMRRQAVNA